FASSALHGVPASAGLTLNLQTFRRLKWGLRAGRGDDEFGNSLYAIGDSRHDLDGEVAWNPARWLNHSCAPNCDAEWIEGRIWIVARRAIRAGEELTFNYGYDLEDYREHPCRCGSPDCV